MNTPKYLVFDLETQKSAEEVGGWKNIHQMRMSIGCVYNINNGQFTHYTEDQVSELIIELLGADLVIGFNLIGFDYKVLSGYTHLDLRQIKTLDLLLELKKRLGYRVSLANVSKNTLGESKKGTGLEALEWFKDNQMDKLIEYCQQDVKLTHLIYEYGKETGHIFASKDDVRYKVSVIWE